MTINPVLLQELRVRMRGASAYSLLTAIILAFGAFTLATYRVISTQIRPIPIQVSAFNGSGTQGPPIDRLLVAQRGPVFFLVMSLWAIILVAFIVPAATSGTFSREREKHTLALLLGTPLHPLSIVTGKLLGAVSYVLLLVAAAIPLFSIAVMFGGIATDQAIDVAIILVVTTFAFGALGVFLSSLTSNAVLASLLSYTIVLALTLGSYGIYLASAPLSTVLSMRYLLYLSPLAAVFSALTQTNLQLSTLVAAYFHEPGTRAVTDWWTFSQYPLWYVTVVAYLAGGLLLLLASSRAINPLRRWL